jgi:hypothetical protein
LVFVARRLLAEPVLINSRSQLDGALTSHSDAAEAV